MRQVDQHDRIRRVSHYRKARAMPPPELEALVAAPPV